MCLIIMTAVKGEEHTERHAPLVPKIRKGGKNIIGMHNIPCELLMILNPKSNEMKY